MASGVIASDRSTAPEQLLSDAVRHLLELDPAELDDLAVHDLVVEVQAIRSRLTVVAAELLAEWDTRGIWQTDGSRTPAHRLARETRTSVRTCKDEIRRARRIRHLPATRNAVADGRLSIDHLDLFGHANTPERRTLFDRDEHVLVDQCTGLSYAHSARAIRYWTIRADAQLTAPPPAAGDDTDHGASDRPDPRDSDDPDQPDPSTVPDIPPPHLDSRLHASRTLDDTLVLDGIFDAVDGTIIDDELHRLTEQIRLADQTAGIDRTPAQRRAAALIEMAKRSATTPANGRRPRPLFTVLIGERTIEHLCELANGTIIPPEVLLPHLRDALLETVLFDGPSTIISVSARRTFTGALRRAIQVRDRRCQHPSECDEPAEHCDVDHIVPHSRNGPTSQFNARIECKPHNRNRRLHDHHATPLPERTITRLDELRALIRWRTRNDNNADGSDAGGG